jgi:hypothetical protein
MATSPATPPPDEPSGLSRRERAILARMEMDLLTDGPADQMRPEFPPRRQRRGWAFAGQAALVVIAVLVGAILMVIVPVSWLAALALLTVQIVLPFVLTMWTERRSGE